VVAIISTMARRWIESLLAVVAGNALYFLVLMPRLPAWLVHEPFKLDAGLALDFVLCAALYLLARGSARFWERS